MTTDQENHESEDTMIIRCLPPSLAPLGRFGHHPDELIDYEVEIERLLGLLSEAHGGLLRALDYRAATPEGLAIKADVRDALRRTGFAGSAGYRAEY
jgi:hypothetical protein